MTSVHERFIPGGMHVRQARQVHAVKAALPEVDFEAIGITPEMVEAGELALLVCGYLREDSLMDDPGFAAALIFREMLALWRGPLP